MTGLIPYSIEQSESFVRSLKKLIKSYSKRMQKTLRNCLTDMIEDLLDNPYPATSRNEPLPTKMQLPEQWTFHKLTLRVSKGASGQVRLMYLVNETDRLIRPIWIYNHEQFVKRPPDKDIQRTIQDALEG